MSNARQGGLLGRETKIGQSIQVYLYFLNAIGVALRRRCKELHIFLRSDATSKHTGDPHIEPTAWSPLPQVHTTLMDSMLQQIQLTQAAPHIK